MSLKTLIAKLFGTKTAAAIETFAENEFDKALAAAKVTPIGAAIATAVAAAENGSLTPAQKIEQAIAAVAPVVIEVAASGGVTALIADAEVFARSAIESALTDLKSTGAAAIAAAVVKVADATPVAA